jgi:hypothetical protein
MSVRKLIAEIEALTTADIERAELSQETDGECIGEPIGDPFLMRVVTMYLREEKKWNEHCQRTDPGTMSPEEHLAECVQGMRLRLLGTIMDWELETHYGTHITQDERESGELILEIREGWKVYKTLNDIPVEELEATLDEEPLDTHKSLKRPTLLN